MNLNLSCSQQISQSLMMTTELMHHLEILQFSEEELRSHIYERANENPFINVLDNEVKLMKNVIDISVSKTYDSFKKQNNEMHFFLQTNIADKESSEKYLLEQVPLQKNLNELDFKILKYLVQHLDDYYFLNVDELRIADLFKVERAYVENLIKILQTFEPAGVGARNFSEYLLIKIANDPTAPDLAYSFVQDNLNLVADYSIKSLSKIYKKSTTYVKEVIKYIKNLKPPVSRSTNVHEEYILPDVQVKKVGGEWVIELFNPTRPRIEINEEYVELLKNNTEHSEYYKECLKDVMLLNQGIQQRDKTLYSVTRLLLKLQPSFFEVGMSGLVPLKLKELATILEVHESTISRTIRNKYIRTPQGIFSLRSLFTKGLINSSGKIEPVHNIKMRIQELIANEDKESPFSDQQLTERLFYEGIKISRRTVAKYREELNILSSNKRFYA